jgi:predicted amino acid dehydrogenase
VKKIASLSLGRSRNDFELDTTFMGQAFHIQHIDTDGDIQRLVRLLHEFDGKVDVIGVGSVELPLHIDGKRVICRDESREIALAIKRLRTPVTTGDALRRVAQEWSLRHIQFKFGNNYFNNVRTFFFSGLASYTVARVLSSWTQNLSFADPILEQGFPRCIRSLKGLERYATKVQQRIRKLDLRGASAAVPGLETLNERALHAALRDATMVVIPAQGFHRYVELAGPSGLEGKTVLTCTAYDDRVELLKERGVEVIFDTTPNILQRVVGYNALEALVMAALDVSREELTSDDILEVISEQRIYPREIYRGEQPRRVNRFAFVIHPLSKEYLKQDRAIAAFSRVTPPSFLDAVEKVIAYAPPFVYSKVTGIRSPTGVEAEGWLITIGGTPKQLLSHRAEFTYKRLLQAAEMARRLGAQIIGLGAFTKVVGDAGVTVAKLAPIPVTTGNSYSASGALWAAADAARRMGLLPADKDSRIAGKAMVIGATGSIGSVCARLLAYAFEEVYMVDVRDARLLALREEIITDKPDARVQISTRADRFLPDMDLIVTATSAAGKKILDIMRVKPGCVITDVARPLDLSPEDVAKRPDVLYIESGEIELPGEVEMRNIGLPPGTAYACLAETIVLALEGRYETFTIGRDIEWPKVKEIYKLGLKHGMKLAAISGVNGVYTDEEIRAIRERAFEERRRRGIPWPGQEPRVSEAGVESAGQRMNEDRRGPEPLDGVA